jgi:patatin-like phospholipase/acyl hydrolase
VADDMAGESRKILSIDGGGIRGLIPALVLRRIEGRTGKPIAELFDVIAGTSTGGILALGLTCPGEDGRPRYTAADLAEMYVQDGTTIFPQELLGWVRQLLEPKYSSKGRDAILARQLGEARLKDALTEVVITAYDIFARRPRFFRSALAKRSAEEDFLMCDVARATSAAPTYFEPVRMHAEGVETPYVLVDGGVFANNPGMCAFVDKSTVQGEVERTLMVSLGTGSLIRRYRYEQARHWGALRWAQPVIDVFLDGESETVDYQLQTILGDRYHRFQVELNLASDELDDASAHNVEELERQADELLQEHGEELDRVCDKLMKRSSTAELGVN